MRGDGTDNPAVGRMVQEGGGREDGSLCGPPGIGEDMAGSGDL